MDDVAVTLTMSGTRASFSFSVDSMMGMGSSKFLRYEMTLRGHPILLTAWHRADGHYEMILENPGSTDIRLSYELKILVPYTVVHRSDVTFTGHSYFLEWPHSVSWSPKQEMERWIVNKPVGADADWARKRSLPGAYYVGAFDRWDPVYGHTRRLVPERPQTRSLMPYSPFLIEQLILRREREVPLADQRLSALLAITMIHSRRGSDKLPWVPWEFLDLTPMIELYLMTGSELPLFVCHRLVDHAGPIKSLYDLCQKRRWISTLQWVLERPILSSFEDPCPRVGHLDEDCLVSLALGMDRSLAEMASMCLLGQKSTKDEILWAANHRHQLALPLVTRERDDKRIFEKWAQNHP